MTGARKGLWIWLALLLASGTALAQGDKRVAEEIIARVNNEIITSWDYQRARSSLRQEAEQDCRGCAPARVDAMVAERDKNLLRDLIDQSLLVQRAKDMGISLEAEVVKRLDQVRQQNNLQSMEELERMVNASGVAFEDFKGGIRNNLLTQEVIRREVGSKIIIGNDEVRKYYEEHKGDFVRPAQVHLSEMFVSTVGKSEAEIPPLEQKAQNLLARLRKGEEFSELAKRFSDATTAKQGGELGVFEPGQLSKEISDVVFRMRRGEVTDVIRTKTGFLILKVEQRFEAGLQPLEKVEPEIMNRLYYEKMQPGLRRYLTELRQDSYVVVKPGYVDTSAAAGTPIVEVAPTAEEGKGKKSKKRSKKAGQ